MRDFFKVALFSLSLLFTDTLISVAIATVYGIVQKINQGGFRVLSYPEAALFLGFARLVYYYFIFVVLFFVVTRTMHIGGKVVRLMLLNLGLYMLISVLYGFIFKPETKDFFTNPLFYILLLSTLLSPAFLCRIPFFRTLSKEI